MSGRTNGLRNVRNRANISAHPAEPSLKVGVATANKGITAVTTFHVKSVETFGKKTWTVERREDGTEPVMVGLRCADPALALADAHRLNSHTRARKRQVG